MALVDIFIAGSHVSNWEGFTCARSKAQHSGTMSVTIFPGPEILVGPMSLSTPLGAVKPSAEVHAYVNGKLAFTGTVDSLHYTLNATSFSCEVSARSKTKAHVDSMHNHPTGFMKDTTPKDVITALNKGTGVKLDISRVSTSKLDHVKFYDLGRTSDEMWRVARDAGLYLWPGADGSLIVSDDTLRQVGPPISTLDPTHKILSIDVTISEGGGDKSKSRKQHKGKRHKHDGSKRGKDAIVGEDKSHTTATFGGPK
jgi:prophage tail gpP-like protein